MKKFATLTSAIALTAGMASAEGVVNVYNWSDYIAEDTVANFEAETGIKSRLRRVRFQRSA